LALNDVPRLEASSKGRSVWPRIFQQTGEQASLRNASIECCAVRDRQAPVVSLAPRLGRRKHRFDQWPQFIVDESCRHFVIHCSGIQSSLFCGKASSPSGLFLNWPFRSFDMSYPSRVTTVLTCCVLTAIATVGFQGCIAATANTDFDSGLDDSAQVPHASGITPFPRFNPSRVGLPSSRHWMTRWPFAFPTSIAH
jgi:hypothetical protein